jgi:hypothetical protein
MKPNPLSALIAFMASGLAGVPVGAQWDPGLVAQGQVLSGTARGYAERGGVRDRASSRTSASDARICASLPQYRARWGRKHPKVLGLARLCRKAGY